MFKKALRPWLMGTLFLISVVPSHAASPMNEQEALLKNDSFVKAAQAIKRGDWKETGMRDIAIVGLFELGRTAGRLESQLQSHLDRFYAFAYRGALILGVYLVLQLVLSLAIVIRLARMRGQASVRETRSPGESFRI